MRIMSKEEVERYLDDLLVELEVSQGDEKAREKFARVANFYWNQYDLESYKERANQILEKYKEEQE